MILRRTRPDQGIRFAWLPVDTPEGRVWLEHVHYRWDDFGLGGCRYERVYYKSCPTWHDRVVDYSRCSWGADRAVPQLGDNWKPQYAAPSDISKCKTLTRFGPTPCHYPHCNCMGASVDA